MDIERKCPVLYLDDGYPESRDYDDNYVPIRREEPRGVLRVLASLLSAHPRPHRGPRTARIEAARQPA